MATEHTISVFVENLPGVLVRVAALFARRGYNIESLAVGPTEHPKYSRMTIVVGLDTSVDQVIQQVKKLIPVVEARELLSERERVDRELMLIKVKTGEGGRAEIREIAEMFRARIVDVSATALMIEATGTPDKLDALEANLAPYGIIELCRTGQVSLERGPTPITTHEGEL
ncbi:MAG: acetolactate synthase small subunit [Candidatus Sericytochromatia bacterium]|nr:acetolactate synthase small subunit [Candidatus Sericytochromatia bacterium]